MFDVDDVADNVVLSGISYLLMLVDTKRLARCALPNVGACMIQLLEIVVYQF